MTKAQTNKTIKLLQSLIDITTNRKDKKELQFMLDKTKSELTEVKPKKYKLSNVPVKTAKELGFKSKKALVDFTKINELDLSNIKNDNEFNTMISKKQKMFTQLQELNKMHEKMQATMKARKPKPINYTAKFHFFQRVSEPRKTATLAERLNDMMIEYPKYPLVTDEDGNIYTQRHLQRLNVIDPRVLYFAAKPSGRTYDYNKKEYNEIWKMLKHDENAIERDDTYIHMIVVSNVETPEIVKNSIEYKPKDEYRWSDDTEGGMYHTFMNYNINDEAKTFNELFKLEHCDYVENNYKANSCYFNILIDTFKKSFENNKHYKFKATYEDFCDLFDVDLKEDNLGLTINKSLVFFKKFGIKLCVIGVWGIIEMYKPEKRNKNLSCDALYILVSNNHCYKLNENLNRFNKLIWQSDEVIKDEIEKVDINNISDNYMIRNTEDQQYNVQYVETLNDVFDDIKQTNDDQNTIKEFVVQNGNLTDILMNMVHTKPSYIPDVVYDHGKITQLRFKISNILGTISTCSTIDAEQKDLIISPEIYKDYHTARNNLYKELFTVENLSTFSKSNLELEKIYPMGPMTGYFDNDDICNIKYCGLDTRKAYTGDFMDIEFYPVYNYFDIWKDYDDHKIEDYNQYLVMCNSKQPEHLLLFPQFISRVTGYKLNRIDYKTYTIMAYKRPSKLVPSNSKDLINKLWETQISENKVEDSRCKKDIFNIISGLLGKKQNKKSLTKIFKNYDEAFYYQTVFGGEIYTIGYEELNMGVFGGNKKLYLLQKQASKDLVTGFVPIKEMIYDIRSLRNYQTYIKLRKVGIKGVGIQTDSILFEKKYENVVKQLFDFTDKIGCYKIEYGKELRGELIQRINNKIPVIDTIKCKIHTIENERDKQEINNKINNCDSMLILGALPGVGKTTTACNYECKKKLFVCPYNKLCQELRKKNIDAITLNMLLGIGFNDEINKKSINYDVSSYDCIIFDEIFLYTPKNLKKIHEFMLQHEDIKILATGDNCQNAPIGMENLNIPNAGEYLKDCISQMFSDQIILTECKRLKNKKDIEKMVNLKNDILDTKQDVMTTIRKYGIKVITDLKKLDTTSNICFFNFRCNTINSIVHNTLIEKPKQTVLFNKIEYYKGLEIICREHYKTKQFRLYVNYTYVISKINKKTVELNEPVENVKIVVPIEMLNKFKLPYANTNHSVQGLTIDKNFTIFDLNTPYINRNWIWTSITRTDDLSKITVFEHNIDEVNSLTASKMVQYFTMKVGNYKLQDKKAGRTFKNDEYVTAEWIRTTKKDQKNECCICKCPLELCLNDGTVTSNVTVDRINNKFAHTKTNCKLSCIKCNTSRK